MSRPVEPAFDEVVHSAVRLRICGVLRRVSEVEFAVVRDTLGLTDAHLSKNLKVLADRGYVTLRKEGSPGRGDARRLTFVGLTPSGSAAVEAHLAALAEIAGGAESARTHA